ncbi:MAG: hypothetical protein FWC67_00300 [Defluviitaleaceae bacterium]|nr:hypothetical protein [Defluviitaleaceae bacterium]
MKLLFFTLIFLLSLFLTGCSHSEVYAPVLPPVIITEAESSEIIYLDVKIELQDSPLSKHEPPAGVFLGACITRAPALNNISNFQSYIGVNHAIFAHTMHLGDAFPLLWVTNNIANSSAPLITLIPPDGGNPYDLNLIKDFAAQASLLNTATFVLLYPILQTSNHTPGEYKAFFREAHAIFAEAAPNVALVWGIDAHNLHIANHFFPGNNYVDWIHLTMHKEISEDGTFSDFFATFDIFNDMFQEAAPLMLSLAVSHYSIQNNRHFPAQAAEKITKIYESFDRYPRLKSIIYKNYNNIAGTGGIYDITTSAALREAYRGATSAPRFLNSIQSNPYLQTGKITLRTPHKAFIQDFDIFVIKEGIPRPIAEIAMEMNADFYVNLQEQILVLQMPS